MAKELRPPREVTRDLYLVWRSPRIGQANPHRLTNPVWSWLARARELRVPVIARAEMLAELMRMKFGIAVAGVNAIGQLSFVPVYPFWALMMFAADIIVIYGLAVYGGKQLTDA